MYDIMAQVVSQRGFGCLIQLYFPRMQVSPPATASMSNQGLQLFLFKTHHGVCAKAMPSMDSSQPTMVQQRSQGTPEIWDSSDNQL